MEGSTYVGEMQGKPRSRINFGIVKTLRKIERIFGKVHVNFGEPVFLDDILKQHNADKIQIEKMMRQFQQKFPVWCQAQPT